MYILLYLAQKCVHSKYLTTEPIPDLLLSHPQLRPLLRAQPLVAVHREVVALIVDHLN